MRRMTLVAALMIALAGASACGGFSAAPQGQPPIPIGPLGPVFDNPDGGPPVECRGLARDECFGVGVDLRGTDIDPESVTRIIVTCLGVCGPQRGEFRQDLLMREGSILEFGRGNWESAP